MKSYILNTLFLLFGISSFADAQTSDSSFVVYGRVLDTNKAVPLSNVHVVNKRNYVGTVTNANGFFYIEIEKGDSVVFSSLGYDYYYYITQIKPVGLVTIYMEEKVYFLNQVDVSAYKLTSNDPKEIKMGKPMIPKDEDIRYPTAKAPTLANPIDLLYSLFDNRAKQLKALQELQAQDAYKTKLQEGTNRETLTNMTGLSKDELEEFLFFCKYTKVQISTMNDYALLMSLMQCYDEYLRIKEREEILEEYEKAETPTEERFK